ncbi:MAG: hypothetical protein DIU78_020385 [Pseudomonadota bacterium]|nr:MAG: hypothetical protein DIU78_09770 [Pseudomonadota bacterium]
MLAVDPFALDRSLARAAAQHRRFLNALAYGDARDHAFELLPSGIDRGALAELRRAAPEDPFAAAAARWAEFLLVEHAAIAERRAAAHALRREPCVVDQPEHTRLPRIDVHARILADAARRDGWIEAYTRLAPPLSSRRLALFERLAETRSALHGEGSISEHVRAVLDAGNAFVAQMRDALRELGLKNLSTFIDRGLGRDVSAEWPVRLTPRRLAEWFHEGGWLRGLSPDAESFPGVLGASSVLRGLYRFGRALHDAGASSRLPFVLAHDPAERRARSFGALFALLPIDRPFAERRLSVSRARFADYARGLGRVIALGAHLFVLRARLAAAAERGATAYRGTFEESVPQVLGFELPPVLAGALFVDEHGVASLEGLFLAANKAASLVETYDEDWFRNPRAIEELRSELESPPEPPRTPDAPAAGATQLARTLLGVL